MGSKQRPKMDEDSSMEQKTSTILQISIGSTLASSEDSL